MASAKSEILWNKIADKYDSGVIKRYSEAYKEAAGLSAEYLDGESSVLDFACGTGIVTLELAGAAGKITAIDSSDRMLAIASEKASRHNISNIEFSSDDIFDSRFDNQKFDVITAYNILLYIEDIKTLLNRIRQLLRPGGVFISVTDCLGEKKSLLNIFRRLLTFLGLFPFIRYYSSDNLEKIIQNEGFSIIQTERLYPNPLNYFIAAELK